MHQGRPETRHRKGKKSIGSIIALLIIAAIAYFFNIDEETDPPPPLHQDHIPVTLIQTIDGDTIKVNYKGEAATIRYLLIDTPEIDHRTPTNTEPFARAAMKRNDELLKSGQVTIKFDVGDQTDQYGRLLAYIYVDGESVQEKLLEEGLARVAYVFAPNTSLVEEFKEAANRAKQAKKGIWEKEGYVTNRGFDVSVYE